MAHNDPHFSMFGNCICYCSECLQDDSVKPKCICPRCLKCSTPQVGKRRLSAFDDYDIAKIQQEVHTATKKEEWKLTPREEFEQQIIPVTDAQWQWLKGFILRNPPSIYPNYSEMAANLSSVTHHRGHPDWGSCTEYCDIEMR